MSNRPRAWLRLTLLLTALVAVLLAACSAAPGMPASGDREPDPQGVATPVPGNAHGPGTDPDGGPTADIGDGRPDGALVIHTGQLRLEVPEIAPAMDSAIRLVVDLGGYVSGSQEENTSSRHLATVTFRIPAARWNDAVRGLRELAERVVNEYTEAVEVTAEVVDLEARIANLRAGEAALQEIMNRAGTIEEVLKVQRELSGVRGEIEQLTARRDRLSNQAAYGTLAVHFETPVVAAAEAQEGWHVSAEFDRALADLIRVSQVFTSIAIWLFIVVLPVVVPVLLVVFVAIRLGRRFTPQNPPPPTA